MNFTPINCYAILYPKIVFQYYPHFKPVLTLKDWESRHSTANLTELKNWITVLASDFKNCHYGQLDSAIAKELGLMTDHSMSSIALKNPPTPMQAM